MMDGKISEVRPWRPDSEQTLLIPTHDIYLEMSKKGNKNLKLSSSRKRVKSSENIEVRMSLSD